MHWHVRHFSMDFQHIEGIVWDSVGTLHGNSLCTYSHFYLFTSDRHCAGDVAIPNFCDVEQMQKYCSLAGPQGLVLCITLHGPGLLQSGGTNRENQKALSDSRQRPSRVLRAPPGPLHFFSHPRRLCSRPALIRRSCVTLDRAAAKTVGSQKSGLGRLSVWEPCSGSGPCSRSSPELHCRCAMLALLLLASSSPLQEVFGSTSPLSLWPYPYSHVQRSVGCG